MTVNVTGPTSPDVIEMIQDSQNVHLISPPYYIQFNGAAYGRLSVVMVILLLVGILTVDSV